MCKRVSNLFTIKLLKRQPIVIPKKQVILKYCQMRNFLSFDFSLEINIKLPSTCAVGGNLISITRIGAAASSTV